MAGTPRATIARLSALRDESVETARLARLLERATHAVLALGLSASAVAAQWEGELAPLLVWLVLLGAGMVAVFRVYDSSVGSPFELVQLQGRSGDLSVILLYVGFAWGMGSFLVLAPDASLGGRLIFAAGAGIVVTAALRSFAFSLRFLLPVTVLAALAASMLPGRLIDAAAVLGSCVVVGLAGLVLEQVTSRNSSGNLPAKARL